jgi:hypothetical protein
VALDVAGAPERARDAGDISMLLVPTPCTTKVMVPASTSQSARVSGISSPSGSGSTRTNWPARAARAMSGERTVNSTMPSLSSALATIVAGAAARFV